jgi:hypothetical protein
MLTGKETIQKPVCHFLWTTSMDAVQAWTQFTMGDLSRAVKGHPDRLTREGFGKDTKVEGLSYD